MAKYTYGGSSDGSANSATSSRWYKEDKDVHNYIFNYLKYLQNNQTEVNDDFYRYMRMYGSMPYLDIATRTTMSAQFNKLPRLTLNVVKSGIDTVHSKMSKNQPRPMFLTDGGNWADQRKAEKLTKYIEGQFYNSKAYRHGAEAMLHALILGTGAVKVWREGDCIEMEAVLVDELFVDKFDGAYGEPRQLHQTKRIHRDVLAEMFPKNKKTIADAKAEPIKTRSNTSDNPDMITVAESWHLPTGNSPGRHCISIENDTLLDEEYKLDCFPFFFLRWRKLPLSFWGQGISEEIKGIQVEINKLLQTIQLSMHLTSVPKLMVDSSSKISLKSLDNKIGGIIRYSGTPPIPAQLGRIPTELFTHLEWLYNKAWEILGISQLSGTSQKPAGLDSGKALREYSDIEAERFLAFGREYEQFYMDIARFVITLSKQIAEDNPNVGVKVPAGKYAETIKWKDVNLEEDAYIMQAFPTNALSTTPAARLNEVSDLINMGFIGREDAMKLLDFPDVSAFYDYELAASQDIEKVISEIVDNGKYLPPEPYQNLKLGIDKMQRAYLLYRTRELGETKLEMMRMWITTANAMLAQAAAEQQMQLQMQQMQMEQPQIEPTQGVTNGEQ